MASQMKLGPDGKSADMQIIITARIKMQKSNWKSKIQRAGFALGQNEAVASLYTVV